MDKGIALDSAKRMADWFVNCMSVDIEQELLYGTFYYYVGRDPKRRFRGAQWNQAFAVMGMLSAGRVFSDEKYLDAAGYIIRARKKGKKCIGCPECSCSNSCGSCPGQCSNK